MKRLFDRTVFILNWVALALAVLALVDFLLHPLARDFTFHSTIYRAVTVLVLTPLTLMVGYLITRRVPGNIVGPLLITWSGTVAYNSLREGIDPVVFSLFFYYDMVFGWLALFLMVAHFPDGKIYPRLLAGWVYRLLPVFLLLPNLIFLSTAYFPNLSDVANPFYLPALQQYAELVLVLGLLLLLPVVLLAMVSPVLRYLTGSLLERQQLKWLALFAVTLAIYSILGLIAYPLVTGAEAMNPGNNIFAVFFYLSTGLLPPVAIGISVLRYRLWDLDIVIRRTLVYFLLTASLALIYLVTVVILQSLLGELAGESQPEIVTVLSTLSIAALFTPLRRRIQELIDKRFYRKKYDAEHALSKFAATARSETDLAVLSGQLVTVVQETVQPDQVSLWLSEGLAGERPPGD